MKLTTREMIDGALYATMLVLAYSLMFVIEAVRG